MFKHKMLVGALAAGLLSLAGAASAQVVGGGATLPENFYNDTATLAPLPGFETYIGVGSGGGKRAFFNNDATEFDLAAGITVDYAGSDSLVTQAEADAYATNSAAAFGPLIQIPAVLTSVTVPYNVPGMSSLELTSEELAQIFAGDITNWSDVGGPSQPIRVIYRTDGSGTTEIFLRHLNAVDASVVPAVGNVFADEVDVSDTTRYLDAEGSGGVAALLSSTPYSITYVSPDFADYDNPAAVASINGFLPTQVNVQEAVAQVPVPATAAQRANPLAWGISNPNPATGYPIVASTNLIFSQCYGNGTDNLRIRDFVNKLYNGTFNSQIGTHSFIPLPAAWATAVRNTFWDTASNLSIGHSSCQGIGRPQ